MNNPIIKPAFALLAVTVAAALLLGIVNVATRDVIAANNEKARKAALAEVLPAAKDFEEIAFYGDEPEAVSFYVGRNDGGVCGFVATTRAKGYSGSFDVTVGIDTEDRITGVSIGDNSETPGLGKEAEKPKFIGQYTGKAGGLRVVKGAAAGDNEIQAVASATITSSGVTEAVNAAAEFVKSVKGQWLDGEGGGK